MVAKPWNKLSSERKTNTGEQYYTKTTIVQLYLLSWKRVRLTVVRVQYAD